MTGTSMISGCSNERLAMIDAFLRAHPWSSAREIADPLLMTPCRVTNIMRDMVAAKLAVYDIRRGSPKRFQERIYAVPGTPTPEECAAGRVPPHPEVAPSPPSPLPQGGEGGKEGIVPNAQNAPYRRADGVLVCPPGYARGYGRQYVTVFPRHNSRKNRRASDFSRLS